MRIKVTELIQTKRTRYVYGFLFASIFWILCLCVMSIQALQQYRDVEAAAYEEVYILRQHNNLLLKENQNLSRIIETRRKKG
jgi:hypothetical protein